MNPLIIKILIVTAVYCAWGAAPSLAQQLLIKDSEKIDFARGLMEQSQYSLSAVQFEEFIDQFAQSSFLEDAYSGAGESHFFLKAYERALSFYRTYLERFPEGKSKHVVLLRVGQCLYLTGKLDEASAQLALVSPEELDPAFDQTLHFYLGQISLDQKQYKQAAAHFEQAALMPDVRAYTVESYLKWGLALTQEREYSQALEKYQIALEKSETDDQKISAYMHQGEAHYLSGQFEKAAEIFKSIVDGYAQSSQANAALINWFHALYEQKKLEEIGVLYQERFANNFDAQLIPLHLIAVKALADQGKIDEGLEILNKILNADGLDLAGKNQAVVSRAQLFIRALRFLEAVEFIDAKISEAADLKGSLVLLKGQAYLGLKDFEKAWSAYQSVSQEFSETEIAVQAICGMAHVRHGQNESGQAADLFLDCFNKSHDENLRKDALYNAFLMAQKSGDSKKTIDIGQLYIQTYPQKEQYLDVVFSMAIVYAHVGEYEQSGTLLNILAAGDDVFWRQKASFQTAYNLQMTGRQDEAAVIYEQIIKESPQKELVYLSLKNSALIFIGKNDETKAAEYLDRAVREFDANDLELKNYLWLAEYWQNTGEPQKMLDVLKAVGKAPSIDPNDHGIKFFTAEAFRMLSDCASAIVLYDGLIALGESVYKGRSRLGKGECLSVARDFTNAAQEFEQAVMENPDDHYVAMRGRFEMARNADANNDLSQAANLYLVVALLYKDPDYAPKALLRAGEIFQQLNNPQESQNAFKQLTDEYPESLQAKKLTGG